jgi:3-hydroxyacyl-CoA dehydrogenase/enoyl-CoA hydratase/3-hydroxybutyryl-CoA epimerase
MAPLRVAAEAGVAKGVVDDADLADAGVIFGAGFPPFTGGPFHQSCAAASSGDRR